MKNKSYPLYSLPEIRDLKDMVRRHAADAPDAVAFSYSAGRNKTVQKTCREFSDDIDALGTFLYQKGYKNSHIAIIGENSYEWLAAFLAIVNGGNVAVPIDKEQPADKIRHLLQQSDCEAVFVSKNYAELVEEVDDITVFYISDFSEYIAEGRKLIDSGITEHTDYTINTDKLAAIFFTSGTTRSSKGVMLSQKNMIYNVCVSRKSVEIRKNVLSVLPFYHAFGLMIGVFSVYCYGCPVYINKSLKQVLNDFQKSSPSAVAFVPLFVETFYKTIMENAKKNGRDKTLLRAVKISDFLLRFGMDLRKKLFKSVHEAFGGNLEYIICGGAPLDEKYVKAFRSWGITILNGYGITECAPVVSVNRNYYWRDGSVGQILDGCKVRIAEDGEILVKGDNVILGYYKDDESTNAVIQEGWYSTGDLGHIDNDGFLFITGRKKNLIILSNGENVSPEEIEAELLRDEAISEAVVYGDKGMLHVEIFPCEPYIGNQEYFDALIANFNQNQPPHHQIQKVHLREKEFEKNSTKKILRYKVTEEYHD